MRAGRLRHIITLQRRSVARTGSGDEVVTWADWKTRRAAVAPLNGREYFAAKQETAEVNHRVRIRYDTVVAAVTVKDRVKFGTRVFDIQFVIDPEERHRELILMCLERV